MKHIHSMIKLIIVTLLATYVTYLLGVTNYLTAGILAMISIQKTKRLSLTIAGKRTILVFFSILLSSALFILLGYNFFSYSMFIILVVICSFQFNLHEGTIPSVVVVTHLFILGQYSTIFILETATLYFVSIGIALLFNIFYPSESYNALEKHQKMLDMTIREHLIYLKNKIEKQEVTCAFTHTLEQRIQDILENINQITGDLIMKNHQDILIYSRMRSKQFDILKSICTQSDKLTKEYPQTKIVSAYLENLSKHIGTRNLAAGELTKIDLLLSEIKEHELPTSRDEFEHRAILYHIILEIRQFILLKTEYHMNKVALDSSKKLVQKGR